MPYLLKVMPQLTTLLVAALLALLSAPCLSAVETAAASAPCVVLSGVNTLPARDGCATQSERQHLFERTIVFGIRCESNFPAKSAFVQTTHIDLIRLQMPPPALSL
jgi:hypothetical protein